jgi:hypothetical protein
MTLYANKDISLGIRTKPVICKAFSSDMELDRIRIKGTRQNRENKAINR